MSGLTKIQRDALLYAANYFDVAADENVCVQIHLKGGSSIIVSADDVIFALLSAFDLKLGKGKFGLRDAIAAATGEVK